MVIKRRSAAAILLLIILFILTAFGLLSVRNGEFDIIAAVMGAAAAVIVIVQYNVLRHVFKNIDRFVLLVADLLWSVGLVVIYRIDPSFAYKQLICIAIGMVACVVAIVVIRRAENFGKWNYLFVGLTFILLALPLVFGKATYGAKNWIEIGGIFSFQPSEFAKILFIIVSAYVFETRDKITSFIPYVAYAAISVVILVLSRDLGTGLLICGTFLIVFFGATGRWLLTLLGVGVVGIGAYGSYKLFSHVRTRVEVWQDPWSSYYDQGYQIVQGLMALASGGLLGVGLGLGSPETIPARHTDYIFAVICEDFGIIFGIMLICFYIIFVVRGVLIALNARSKFDALLVFGCTSMLTLQSFIIIGGVIKLIPLTGITLPFVSYGGSSMLASMIQLGIIEGVAIKNGDLDEEELIESGGEVL